MNRVMILVMLGWAAKASTGGKPFPGSPAGNRYHKGRWSNHDGALDADVRDCGDCALGGADGLVMTAEATTPREDVLTHEQQRVLLRGAREAIAAHFAGTGERSAGKGAAVF